jgi:hypothetical protein
MDLRPEINPPIPNPLDHDLLLKRVDLMAVNAKFEAARMGEKGAIWTVTMDKLRRLVLSSLAGTGKNNRPVR